MTRKGSPSSLLSGGRRRVGYSFVATEPTRLSSSGVPRAQLLADERSVGCSDEVVRRDTADRDPLCGIPYVHDHAQIGLLAVVPENMCFQHERLGRRSFHGAMLGLTLQRTELLERERSKSTDLFSYPLARFRSVRLSRDVEGTRSSVGAGMLSS